MPPLPLQAEEGMKGYEMKECACGCGKLFSPAVYWQRFATPKCKNKDNARAYRKRQDEKEA